MVVCKSSAAELHAVFFFKSKTRYVSPQLAHNLSFMSL